MPDDLIVVRCPQCDGAFDIPADLAGLPVTCKACDHRFVPVPPSKQEVRLQREREEVQRANQKEQARREKEKAREQWRRESEKNRAAHARGLAQEEARHAKDMEQPAQRGDIEQLHEDLHRELVNIRKSTDGIPTIRGIMIFFVILALIGCCVALVQSGAIQ